MYINTSYLTFRRSRHVVIKNPTDSQRTLSRCATERNLLQECVWELFNLRSVRHSVHDVREPLWHLPKFERPDPISESILGSLVCVSSSDAHKHFWNLLGAVCLSGAASRLRELQGSRFMLNKWLKAASPYVSLFIDFAALRDLDLEFYHPGATHYPRTPPPSQSYSDMCLRYGHLNSPLQPPCTHTSPCGPTYPSMLSCLKVLTGITSPGCLCMHSQQRKAT
jgi:hypothetical protein